MTQQQTAASRILRKRQHCGIGCRIVVPRLKMGTVRNIDRKITMIRISPGTIAVAVESVAHNILECRIGGKPVVTCTKRTILYHKLHLRTCGIGAIQHQTVNLVICRVEHSINTRFTQIPCIALVQRI